MAIEASVSSPTGARFKRVLFLVAACFALAGAAPGKDRALTTSHSLETQITQPCDQGHDNRNSDLCAQWKAADAAQSSSEATWLFGWIGSVIGGLTLAAAVAAAFYAKKAAKHAEDGTSAFFEAERAILHAISGAVGNMDSDGREVVSVTFANRGRTAGRIIEFGSKGGEVEPEGNSSRRWTTVAPDGQATVAGFAPPERGATLKVQCWINYVTLGPKVHTSHFTVTVFWIDMNDDFVISIPHWVVETSNPNGHPNDT